MVVYIIMGSIGPVAVKTPLPKVLLPFRYASPMKWACEALCAAEFSGQDFDLTAIKANSSKKATLFLQSYFLFAFIRCVLCRKAYHRRNFDESREDYWLCYASCIEAR